MDQKLPNKGDLFLLKHNAKQQWQMVPVDGAVVTLLPLLDTVQGFFVVVF